MDKTYRGNASQFFVAGELCRRGYAAVVTLGNTPNTDILCSNSEGTRFVHVQVKTFVPGTKTVSVGIKAEKLYGENFIWVLAGIPQPDSNDFIYFIIPSAEIAKNVSEANRLWLARPGIKGQPHNPSNVRTIHLPPAKCPETSWNIDTYRNRWETFTELLKTSAEPCSADK